MIDKKIYVNPSKTENGEVEKKTQNLIAPNNKITNHQIVIQGRKLEYPVAQI